MQNKNKNIRYESTFSKEIFSISPSFLSSGSFWVTLIISDLLLVQTSSLRALNPEDSPPYHCPLLKLDDQKSSGDSPRFYKDSEHPLTQGFWKEHDLSDRLKNLKPFVDKIREKIINCKTGPIKIDISDLEECQKILGSFDFEASPIQGLDFIHFEDLSNTDSPHDVDAGYSGAEVKILSDGRTKVAIKKFKDLDAGIRELFSSLIALDINPAPKKIKMTRVYDAILYPKGSISIIMEGANTHDIQYFLSTSLSGDVVRACAEYLAMFHIKNNRKLNEPINNNNFMIHAANFFHTLSYDPLKEPPRRALFSLFSGQQWEDLEDVKSNNIIRLLSKEEQEKFVSFAKISRECFEENVAEIYRSLLHRNIGEQSPYFLTTSHGDAHGRNFFYDDSDDLADLDGFQIRRDSFHRIFMIDFASIIETYGDIGDPAEDVGRFLGSLWDWAAQQDFENDEQVYYLQNQFIETYLQKIKKSGIFTEETKKTFERIFKENYNFYKLRYYRAIFNSEKERKSDATKLKILKSWIRENSELEEERYRRPFHEPSTTSSTSIPTDEQQLETTTDDKKPSPSSLESKKTRKKYSFKNPRNSGKLKPYSLLKVNYGERDPSDSPGLYDEYITSPVIGDGNCFFYAVFTEENKTQRDMTLFSGELRSQLAEVIMANDRYKDIMRRELLVECKMNRHHENESGILNDLYQKFGENLRYDQEREEKRKMLAYEISREHFQKEYQVLDKTEQEEIQDLVLSQLPEHLRERTLHVDEDLLGSISDEAVRRYIARYEDNSGRPSSYIEIPSGKGEMASIANVIAEYKDTLVHCFLYSPAEKKLTYKDSIGRSSSGNTVSILYHGIHYWALYNRNESENRHKGIKKAALNHENQSAFYPLIFTDSIFPSSPSSSSMPYTVRQSIQEQEAPQKSEDRKAQFATDTLPASMKASAFVNKKSRDLPWTSVETDQKDIIAYLPDRPVGFIESAAEGSDKSYLTLLWEELHRIGTATLSSEAAIAGMGGIGKTSLALGYAHEAKNQRAYNLIYWLRSATELSLLEGYKNLLQEMGICIKGSDDACIIELVKQHVPKRGRCLLIYDNVPDSDFLKDKIPQENTHTLMTSRCSQGWERPPLILDVFSSEDSVEYLLNITGLESTPTNTSIAEELAKELGYFPLALGHAAHYLKLVGGKDVSEKHFKDYLEAFRAKPTIHFEENRNRFIEAESEITYEHLIGKTFGMSRKLLIDNLDEDSKLAEELMAYCAYLDPDAISEEIFLEFYSDEEKLKKVVNLLSNLSLIKKQAESLFSIHRLVQLVIRNEKEAKENQRYEEVFSHLVPAFVTFFEKNIYTSVQINKLLNNFHHILRLLEHSWRLKRSCQEDKPLEHLELIGKILYTTLTLGKNSRFFMSSQEGKTNKSQKKKIKENQDLYSKKGLLLFKNSKKIDDFPAWLTNLAQDAHPSIQFVLAMLYARSIYVVNKNEERAVYWFRKAASQGHVLAQTEFGAFLLETTGAHHNYEEAFKWLTEAANQGDLDAYTSLANMYARGLGVEKDHEMAFHWSMEAAKKKNKNSIANVGTMYLDGRGVEKNINKAIAYLTEAAEQGHYGAQFYLGMVYYNGEEVEKDDNKAIEWLTKSAEQEFAESQFLLGKIYCQRIYSQDREREESTKKGLEWFKKAAKNELTEASYLIGMMYYHGLGVEENRKEGIQWLTKAAEQGHEDAEGFLSLFLPWGEEEDDDFQGYLSLTTEVKEEEAVAEVVQQTHDSNEYTSQGDAYMAEAIKYLEEGDTALAEYFTEQANENYALAEDLKLATTLQE